MRVALPIALVALVAGVAGAGCGGRGGDSTVEQRREAAAAAAKLSRRQLIGQHFVFAYRGMRPPRSLERRIRRGEAAGVVLFSRNVRSVPQVRATVRRLQALPRPDAVDAPLLVLVDQEGGPVRRLPGPPEASAADTADADAAGAGGRAAGRLLRSAGVNVDFAPVVDVARPGSAMEREGRAYGSDADTVVDRAGAFADGLRDAGVEPVLKHFPGFGAATVNTDDGTAHVDLALATLRAVDLAPYRRLRSRVVMLSTAVYRRVDPRPAAFSRRWVRDELRGRLGFRGVAVTDDLQGEAVRPFGTPAQLAYFALAAGVDLPLFARDFGTGAHAADGLLRAPLTRRQLEDGAARVLALRRALGQG